MEYIFDIGPLQRPELADQLAQGLDLRTELKSRQQLPRLWKKTDQLNERTTDSALARRRKKNKVFGILFLVLGVILAVAGLSASSGLNGPLIGGIMALLVGLSYLSPKSKNPPRKCQQMAQRLLALRQSAPAARVCFTEAGMTVNSGALLTYDKLEGVLETADLYLLIINNSAMFLTKDEAVDTDCAAFSAFLDAQPNLRFQKIGA